MLGAGTNLALTGLGAAGIPGVSTAASILGGLSGWIGFAKAPQIKNGQMQVPPHPIGVKSNLSVNRSHFLPQLNKSDTISESTVPLAPNVQMKSFQHELDVPMADGAAHFESNRVFIGSLPVSATAGDVLFSVPLDLLTGPLKGTKAAYNAAQWDLVCWCAAALLYIPQAAATTAGGLIAVSSPDPTRTIIDIPFDQRVAAAWQYGDDMIASNLWSEGLAMRIPIDKERKYQSFKVATDTDEALKLGGAGRVEIICSTSYTADQSPGMLVMDLDFMFTNAVPVLGGQDALSSAASTDFVILNTTSPSTCWRCADSNLTSLQFQSTNTGSFGYLPFSSSDQEGHYNAMTMRCGSGYAGGTFGYSQSQPKLVRGGLASAGIRYDGYNSSNGRYALVFPPGTWFVVMILDCPANAGSVSLATMVASDGTAHVAGTATAVYQSGSNGQASCISFAVVAPAGGGSIYLVRGATSGTASNSGAIVGFHMAVARQMATAGYSPLMDDWAIRKLCGQGAHGYAQATNVITDVEAWELEQNLGDVLSDKIIHKVTGSELKDKTEELVRQRYPKYSL